MAFTKTWNEGDLGATLQNAIDDIVEDTRIGTRERGGVEHITYATEGANVDVWQHKPSAGRTNFGLAANLPDAPSGAGEEGRADGSLFYETDTGLLKYYDDAGAEWVTLGSPNHSGLVTTYTEGTIDVTLNSPTVDGTSTDWTGNISTGDALLGPDGDSYNILSVDSNIQITLDRDYLGSNAAGQSYTIELDGHPQYLNLAGGTIDGGLIITLDNSIGGNLAVTGNADITGTLDVGDTADIVGILTMGAAIAMATNKITGLGDGSDPQDAVAFNQLSSKRDIATDTYAGDNSTSRSITGVGFEPIIVFLYSQSTDSNFQLQIKTDQDGSSTKSASGSYVLNRIVSLDADGFTLGSATTIVNATGTTYTYIAIG